ncbi:hypothetical protein LMG31506_02170 [Cupriavidus yeoncheonensis]|uniref:Glycosyltransferase n=1 Tax=Cupriavidus yeoncheonensis TaxID=1462994 RepID=A0A916IRN8_9BURK|nr:glycosyltransferase [Cupriavidus yeoncheonensis]CAG2140128.1 hypothetical protein LMG31506_02170 [Cupriavidus yeoncheonensis]
MSRRLLVIANDIPWPANSGGRVDVWRRLNALHNQGIEVSLLCWYDVGRNLACHDEAHRQLAATCKQLRVIPIRRTFGEILARLVRIFRLPSHAASRWVTTPAAEILAWAADIAPTAVLLDGLYGAEVAKLIAKTLDVPLLYRSHNVEHAYMRAQFDRATTLAKRLGLLANLVGLKRYERSLLLECKRIFDISVDDLRYWKASGIENMDWLPPLVDDEFCERMRTPVEGKSIDLLYFGNLHTPNNVNSVKWLIEKVLPRINQRTIKMVIAGSNPCSEVIAAIKADRRIHLVANPSDMTRLISAATVIVNPMLAGSGVNLKSVEMLFSNASLVSTSVGVSGLPPDVKACFQVSDDPVGFAENIMRCLTAPAHDNAKRVAARRYFSPEVVTNKISICLGELLDPKDATITHRGLK